MTAVMEHRRARAPKKERDDVVALDMFAGFGGMSEGLQAAGVDVWFAANHNPYAVDIHERNHPQAEHFIADLVDDARPDYFHPEQLPAADWLHGSPSCVHHSPANAKKAYRRNLSLFDIVDDEYEERVTDSERSRATAVCLLQYARKHHPKVVTVENVAEFAFWGEVGPGQPNGDGSAFQWWLKEFGKLGYKHRVLYLNSMFFGVPQSRDRMYVVFWKKELRTPDLDFRPAAWCPRCDAVVDARQTFKTGGRGWPTVEWGKYGRQYLYRCPSCASEVKPMAAPAYQAIDWSDLGGRIGDRTKALAPATMQRIERAVAKFKEYPAFLVPAKAVHGSERTVDRPMTTLTGQQETALVTQAAQMVMAGNTFEWPGSECRTRSMTEPGWTQHTTPATGAVFRPAAVVPLTRGAQPMPVDGQLPTQTGAETVGLVQAAISVERTNNAPRSPSAPLAPVTTSHGAGQVLVTGAVVPYRANTLETHLSGPTPTFTAEAIPALLTSMPMLAKQNGGPFDTAWHPVIDPTGTLTSVDTSCMVVGELEAVAVEDCFYRMLKVDEIRAGMGFRSEFEMWGSKRDRVKGLGNAVTPPVGEWIALRVKDILQ